jgi:hypothetical protein
MRTTSFLHARPFQILALAVLLAGFAARLAVYDYHGLEGDDGFSLALSRTPVDTLVPGLMRLELDIHPPLHFLALKGWAALAGESLLSLRLMNILADLLTGTLLLRLTGRALGRPAGLAAAVLWVTAPLLIYSTYLIRMYSLSALFAAAGAVCVVELLRSGRGGWAWGLGLAALAGLYTQVVGVVAVGAFAVALAAGVVGLRQTRRALAGLAALVGAALLFLPFALPVLAVYRSGRTLGATINTSSFGSPAEIPGTLARTLLLHRPEAPGLLVLALLMAASMLVLWRWRGRALPLVALAWAGILGMMALAAVDLYKPRYLAPFVAPALALLAGGAVALPRRGLQAAALLGLVAAGTWGVLADLDRVTRDDWVAAAAFVQAYERSGDTVIVIPDWGAEAFRFHYRGAAPVTGVFPHVSADVDYGPILASLVEGHDGVWLVRYQPEVSDPDALADSWLAARAPTSWTVFPAGMQLKYYDLRPERASLPADARPLDAVFGNALALRGVLMPVTAGPATDSRLHPPSNWVHVTLYWEALHSGVTLMPRVRLTDPFGQVYGEAFAGNNGILARAPVEGWEPGQLWQVPYTLNVNPATPPGGYNIEVMALDPASGQPVPATGADAGANWVIAGYFTVE